LRIKIGSGLIPLNLLVMALVLVVIFAPPSPAYNVFRIILGLPLILFTPGYALVAALFPKQEELDTTERMALSFGLSIAIVPLIGLILNYTPLGVKLEPVLYATTGFTFFISLIAIWRRVPTPEPDRFNIRTGPILPGWQRGVFGKLLSILLAVAILGSLGMLGYVIAAPKAEEPFTEFYISDYPAEFVIAGGKVIGVGYGDNEPVNAPTGRVILGIVNNEYEETTYRVSVTLDNKPLEVSLNGDSLEYIGPITLAHEEKWEQEIGFIPISAGDKQKVELQLYKDDNPYPYRSLHFWIDVRVQG
jgi:uncharacterized membrane protein